MKSDPEPESTQAGRPRTTGDEAGTVAARELASSMHQMDSFVGRFGEVARAEACIGPMQSANGHSVVPLASVSLQAGFGMGFGGGSNPEAQGQGSGGGGGGGGRGTSRVIALVDISEDGVNVRPVPDITTLALAMLALLGIAIIATRGRPGAGLLRFVRPQQL
jgi:uncharacterized spore protein YtfJ